MIDMDEDEIATTGAHIFNDDVLVDYPKLTTLLPLVMEGSSFIAGGVFKDILEDRDPKDVDVFFYNAGGYNDMVERFRKSSKYKFRHHTHKSTAFEHEVSGTVVDLVCYQFGTPGEVIDRFDFTVCKAAMYNEKNGKTRFINHPAFRIDLDQKILRMPPVAGTFAADGLFNRIIRYTRYGYNIDVDTKVRLFESVRRMENLDFITPVARVYP